MYVVCVCCCEYIVHYNELKCNMQSSLKRTIFCINQIDNKLMENKKIRKKFFRNRRIQQCITFMKLGIKFIKNII